MSKDNPTPEESLIEILSALVMAQNQEFEKELGVKDSNITITSIAIMDKARKRYLREKGILDVNAEDYTWLFVPNELAKVFRTSMIQLKQYWESLR